MKQKYGVFILIVLMGAVFISCQAHHAPVVHPQFQPVDLNAEVKSGVYQPKVENFVVILDASTSTRDMQNGRTSFESAKAFLYRMNRSIPQMNLSSTLRSSVTGKAAGRQPCTMVPHAGSGNRFKGHWMECLRGRVKAPLIRRLIFPEMIWAA